jgi:hypothetical protein
MNTVLHPTDGLRKMQAVGVRRDLRRSLETRANFWHATIVSSFFIIVVGASLFLGVVMMIGTIRGSSNELTADGRTARIARTLSDGKLCHYIVFDNKTAQAVEDRIGLCDEVKPKPRKEAPASFSWGR